MKTEPNRIIYLLRTHAFWPRIRRRLSKRKKFFSTNPEEMNKIMVKYFGFYKDFDCGHPRTYSEMCAWLKMNYRDELWYKCADKLGSKEFLKEHGLEKYLVKTYKVYSSSSEIDLDELPDDFVLKANHDCGSVYVCHKGKTNFEQVFKKLDSAMVKNPATYGDWVYEKIEPRIFAEELLKPAHGNDLADFKFHCYNGKFGWGCLAQNRSTNVSYGVFEGDYEFQDVGYVYLKPKKYEPKPEHYDEMVRVSEEISKILDYVRVDFYETDQGPKIGELSFFTGSGGSKFTKKEYDFKYGKMFENCRLASLLPKGEKD